MPEITVWTSSSMDGERQEGIDMGNTIWLSKGPREAAVIEVCEDTKQNIQRMLVSDRKEDQTDISKFISKHLWKWF